MWGSTPRHFVLSGGRKVAFVRSMLAPVLAARSTTWRGRRTLGSGANLRTGCICLARDYLGMAWLCATVAAQRMTSLITASEQLRTQTWWMTDLFMTYGQERRLPRVRRTWVLV